MAVPVMRCVWLTYSKAASEVSRTPARACAARLRWLNVRVAQPHPHPLEDEMTEPSAAVPPPVYNTSMAEDFVDIFASPAKVFARRATASPMVPYLVVCVVMIALFFASKNVLQPIFDAQFQKAMALQMKTNPQFTQEMADKAKPFMNMSITIGGVIGVPILLLIVGLVTWIVGRFFMSSTLTFGTALLISAFSWFPRLIESVIVLVQGLTMDVSRMTSPYQLQVSAARFFDPASMSDGLYQLLAQADVFSIWGTVLVAIGLMHAGKLDKSKATITAVILFVCGAVPAIWAVANGR